MEQLGASWRNVRPELGRVPCHYGNQRGHFAKAVGYHSQTGGDIPGPQCTKAGSIPGFQTKGTVGIFPTH